MTSRNDDGGPASKSGDFSLEYHAIVALRRLLMEHFDKCDYPSVGRVAGALDILSGKGNIFLPGDNEETPENKQ